MMKTFAPGQVIDSSELAGMALIAGRFYDQLANVRPELGSLPLSQRRAVRESFLVDSAVMMHGYAYLMRQYNEDLARMGPQQANKEWHQKLSYLSPAPAYNFGSWSGDLFSKENPLWQEVGILKPGRVAGKPTIVNTGGSRAECGRILRQLLSLDARPDNLNFLAAR